MEYKGDQLMAMLACNYRDGEQVVKTWAEPYVNGLFEAVAEAAGEDLAIELRSALREVRAAGDRLDYCARRAHDLVGEAIVQTRARRSQSSFSS